MLTPAACLLIAEVAQAHDGSLGTAHAYIDAATKAGADAVKFQTHFAADESTLAEPWRVKFSRQDATRYDYWRRMELTEEQWAGLKQHCDEAGVIFLSSAFSPRAVRLLDSLGMPLWKVASGELTNGPLLDMMLATGRPMLASSGMSGWEDLDRLANLAKARGVELAMMQCTTQYPTAAENVGLNVMQEMAARYGCLVGLSDHSGTIYPGLAAAALGASAVEVHIAFSRQSFGPDVSSSLTLEELAVLAAGIRFTERMRANPVDKAAMAEGLAETKRIFSRSIVAARDLAAGTVLRDEDLACKKPGGGLLPDQLASIIGRTLNRDLKQDEPLQEGDWA